jgi:hypothetical protein
MTGPPPVTGCDTQTTHLTLAVAAYQSIDAAVNAGCVTFAANASPTDSAEYLVVAQSAGGAPGSSAPFALQGGGAAAAAFALGGAPAGANAAPTALRFDAFLRGVARSRTYAVPPGLSTRVVGTTATQTGRPVLGNLRAFKVCATLTCSSFANVAARVQAVGAHIAVYVDTLAPAAGLDSADLDTLKQVFDARLYPLDSAAFGNVTDIDGDSVVTVLMTGVVNKLVTANQCHTSGFVAGFFFAGDLDPLFASQFNHGEVFYSIVADPGSTLSCAHTRADVKGSTPITFTHEFQHMISFVQHVIVRGGQSEEGWLDEGLSKYAEELAGRSYLPGDPATFSEYAIGDLYDAYQYLLAPGTAPLLIPEDNGTLAEIGASWLFARYLVDQFGDSLPRRLVHSGSIGSANVAAQTGQPFDVTVTRWALANWVSDLPGFATPGELRYTTWHFRTTFASLNGQDPSTFPLAYPLVPVASAGTALSLTGALWSGSGVYTRVLQPPGSAGFTLRLSGEGGAAINNVIVPRFTVIRIR